MHYNKVQSVRISDPTAPFTMSNPWHGFLLWLFCLVLVLRAADAQQCRLCENSTYCFLETQFICPVNSRSLPGSNNITDCVCIAGHYATEDHICRPCEPGFFCPGDESLQLCASNSSSDVFATSAADCFCVPGFSGSSSACAPCLPGSAKHGNGSAACVLCVAGKFQHLTATSECATCPLHTNTPGRTGSIAASACVSNPGYFNNIGIITACVPGTFQSLANQTVCTDCKRGNVENRFYTLQNASTSDLACLACPDFSEVLRSVSGHGILSCACSARFAGPDGGPCAACVAGSVKAGAGNHACAECAANEYANPLNTICIVCTCNSTSPAASDNRSACVCAAGFALNPFAPFDCQECAAGQRAVMSGGLPVCEACTACQYNNLRRQTACTPCPLDEYQPAMGQLACLACPASSVSLVGAVQRSECLCMEGFGTTPFIGPFIGPEIIYSFTDKISVSTWKQYAQDTATSLENAARWEMSAAKQVWVSGGDRLGMRYLMPANYDIVRVKFGSNFDWSDPNYYMGLHIDGVEMARAVDYEMKTVEFPYTPGQELYIFEQDSLMRHELVITLAHSVRTSADGF